MPDSELLNLPCGKCLGCKKAHAKAWALRCHLELAQHNSAAFTTLTYDEKTLPPTLSKRDLQLFLKRLRKTMGPKRPIRFFACGEYGETNYRPHYHAILFGASEKDREAVDTAWGKGLTKTVDANPATINYVAGYTAKKLEDERRLDYYGDMVDPATGEVYTYVRPFLQMSRRPGIGGDARKHTNSWRLFAICNGTKQPVPRFLHESYKNTATAEQLEDLAWEKTQLTLTRHTTLQMLEANEKIEQARQALRADKRRL